MADGLAVEIEIWRVPVLQQMLPLAKRDTITVIE
jgi:hypothetical protein